MGIRTFSLKSLLVLGAIWPSIGTCQIVQDSRKKIVVIDTPIAQEQLSSPFMCQNGSISIDPKVKSYYTQSEYSVIDFKFHHGQNIVGLIGSKINTKKYCIYHIAFFFPKNEKNDHFKDYYRAILEAILLENVAGINLSISGMAPDDLETVLVGFLNYKKVVMNVSIGNESTELTEDDCKAFPSCLKLKLKHKELFTVVGSYTGHYGQKDCDQKKSPNCYTNRSKVLGVKWVDGTNKGSPMMSGTSQATAIITGDMFSK